MAFIDFREAFDMVDREILMKKLWKKGVRGKMFKMIEGIYNRTTNEIITGEGISDSFGTRNGVRQGSPLRGALFNKALDDLDDAWERKKEGGTVTGGTKFYALKYADDIAIIAEDAGELGIMLKSLEKYVIRAEMVINVQNIKNMIFGGGGGGGEKRGEEWKLLRKEIEVVSEFKYLGYWFTTRNTAVRNIRHLVGKAKKAIISE